MSQDGHPWSTQATATDYVDKIWPFDYAWAYYRSYDSEFVPLAQQFASEPLAGDPTRAADGGRRDRGYLWDDAYDHGVSFRDYGEGTPWDDPHNCHSGTVSSDLTHLQARFGEHVDPRYPGWNLDCSDHAVREPEWEREFRGVRATTATLPGARGRVPAQRPHPGHDAGHGDAGLVRGRQRPRRRPAGRRRLAQPRTGAAPRSSSSRTTPRTAPTTSTPTAPRRSSSARSRSTRGVDSTHYDTAGMLGDDRGHARASSR